MIPLENSATDDVIINHIKELARVFSSEILLVHVADGFVARNQETLNLQDSEEIESDREYLAKRTAELSGCGFTVSFILEMGEPTEKLLTVAKHEKCDLIAMATHGHRFFSDILFGSVAESLRHKTSIPILMVREQ